MRKVGMILLLNFAHRGSLTKAPENTLAAMEKALEQGAKAIELDVQLTKDKQLIVIHDHHFKKYNQDITGKVNEYTLGEIKQFDIGTSFSKTYKDERLATLEEVLAIVPKDITLNIEIKNIPLLHDGIEGRLLDCLKNARREEEIIISSFDHVALERIQRQAPHYPIGLLFYYRMLRPWEYAKHTGLDIYSLHPNVVYTTKEFIENSHEAGFRVYPFTVNQLNDYDKLVSAGVDGVFSNNPKIFGVQ